MKNKLIKLIFIGSLVIVSSNTIAQYNTIKSAKNEISLAKEKIKLLRKIKRLIPNVEIKELPTRDHFKVNYEIKIKQNLDHQNSSLGKFDQYIYLTHAGFNQPTLLETEGYKAYNSTKELSQILTANQLIVEYRFYGKSMPNEIPWKHLNNKQAADDLHRIVGWFKKIYRGKWISSGVSKGGGMALVYNRFYPNDVDVCVPYVAPLILDLPDKRTDLWQFNVGDEICRKEVFEMQKTILKRKKELIPFIKRYYESKKIHFDKLGLDTIIQYQALEYPFAFWQWGKQSCNQIPSDTASAEVIFNHINKVNNVDFYSDEEIKDFEVFYYQMATELGYYDFPQEHLGNLIDIDPESACFLPDGVNVPEFDPSFSNDISEWITNNGTNILYIYGGYDTWTSCAVSPSEKTNQVVMVHDKGFHNTRIKSFPINQQNKIYQILNEWLGVDIPIKNHEQNECRLAPTIQN